MEITQLTLTQILEDKFDIEEELNSKFILEPGRILVRNEANDFPKEQLKY